MLPLLIFSALLVGLLFFIEPSGLLCASTLSLGFASAPPNAFYALALIPLFFALRSNAGFVLLVPSIVSAAMTPEAAVLSIVGSAVLLLSRFRAYMPFVLFAAFIVLVLLVGLPLSLLALLALTIPLVRLITPDVWRIRALFAWFFFAIVSIVALAGYVDAFPFALIGVFVFPIEPVVFVALGLFGILSIERDSNARIARALFLFASSVLFAPLALFAMPLFAGVLASSIFERMGPERLRGARIATLVIVVLGLVAGFSVPDDPVDVERGIVFTPDFVDLACDARTFPERIDRSGDFEELAAIDDPEVLDGVVASQGVTHVVYPDGFDAPIVFAVEHSILLEPAERDGLIVASLS